MRIGKIEINGQTSPIDIVLMAVIIGVALIIFASCLKPYKNAEIVENARLAYPADGEDSQTASERYWAIRESQLTPKYTMINFGLTIVATAIIAAVFSLFLGTNHLNDIKLAKTPAQSWKVVVLGLTAAIATPIAFVADLFIGSAREEFPPWADSLGIPLMGVPIMFVISVVCAIFFSLIGFFGYHGGYAIANAFRHHTRPNILWHIILGIPLLISVLMAILELAFGQFYYLASSLLWVAFFILFFAGKQKLLDTSVNNMGVLLCENELDGKNI